MNLNKIRNILASYAALGLQPTCAYMGIKTYKDFILNLITLYPEYDMLNSRIRQNFSGLPIYIVDADQHLSIGIELEVD